MVIEVSEVLPVEELVIHEMKRLGKKLPKGCAYIGGTAVAHYLPSPIRTTRDIDLAVPRNKLGEVISILKSSGYECLRDKRNWKFSQAELWICTKVYSLDEKPIEFIGVDIFTSKEDNEPVVGYYTEFKIKDRYIDESTKTVKKEVLAAMKLRSFSKNKETKKLFTEMRHLNDAYLLLSHLEMDAELFARCLSISDEEALDKLKRFHGAGINTNIRQLGEVGWQNLEEIAQMPQNSTLKENYAKIKGFY